MQNDAYHHITSLIDNIVHTNTIRHHVELVVVTKGQSAESIRQLNAYGQIAFAESYWQEAKIKQQQLSDLPLEWHFIGRIQKNKAATIARSFDWVQSVDDPSMIELMGAARTACNKPLNICLQVNISNESQKGGIPPEDLEKVAALVDRYPGLKLRGLMAIPARQSCSTQAFKQMNKLFKGLKREYAGIDTLSMGMSDDFEEAIVEGATMLRIGRAIFNDFQSNTRG